MVHFEEFHMSSPLSIDPIETITYDYKPLKKTLQKQEKAVSRSR